MAGQLRAVFLKLFEGGLDARRRYCLDLRASEATLGDKALDLPRVTLVLDAPIKSADHTVEDTTLFRVFGPRSHARGYRQLVVLGKSPFQPV